HTPRPLWPRRLAPRREPGDDPVSAHFARRGPAITSLLLLALTGCAWPNAGSGAPALRRDPAVPVFTDVASAAAIHFRQGHAKKQPLTILEAAGSGCAFLD